MPLQEVTIPTSPGVQQVAAVAPQHETVAKRERASLPEHRKEPEAGARARARAGESESLAAEAERGSRARLSLDTEAHRVYVEIIDPETGDVISRFPPEQIATHIDEVLEQTGQQTNLQDAGLIVDRSV
jgi:uncharacterized FlaG/YvyC family protein